MAAELSRCCSASSLLCLSDSQAADLLLDSSACLLSASHMAEDASMLPESLAASALLPFQRFCVRNGR